MKPSTAAVIDELRTRGQSGLTQLQALERIPGVGHVTRYVLHEKPEQMAAFG